MRLLNIIYGYFTEHLDSDGLRDFDLQLKADPVMVAKHGAPSKGADALMGLMGGKKPKPAGGAS